jgi:DNA topoisomerase VI subunit B
MIAPAPVAFETSRLMDFFSEKELVAQSGHERSDWPLVILKELVDNALDCSEDAAVPPQISVTVDNNGITVADRGPGIPPDVVSGILKFDRRVSSREAQVPLFRGALGTSTGGAGR